jgi:hypothetical protein
MLYAVPCLTFACATLVAPCGRAAVSTVFTCGGVAVPFLVGALCLHLLVIAMSSTSVTDLHRPEQQQAGKERDE